MACRFGYLGALSLVLSTACSDDNPLFYLATISGGMTEVGETTDGQGTTTTPTGGEPTTGRTTTGQSDSNSAGMTDGMSATDVTDGTTQGSATTLTSDPNMTTDPADTSGDGSTGVVDGCGDGQVEGDEQCDHGDNNGVVGECTSDCKFDSCGNGYTGPKEDCDDGLLNSDNAACTLDCKNNVCGDGHTYDAQEVCDAGSDNGQKAPGCSIDCKALIPDKTLRIAVALPSDGKLDVDGKVGVMGADALCSKMYPGFRAMISGPGRVASTGPYDGANQSQDWPVQKYRGYTRKDGVTLVFVTGSEGLLGVANKLPVPLQASIGAGMVWTGFEDTWISAPNTCSGWVDPEEGLLGRFGDAGAKSGEFISAGDKPCGGFAGIYCVEVP